MGASTFIMPAYDGRDRYILVHSIRRIVFVFGVHCFTEEPTHDTICKDCIQISPT